MVNEYRAAKWSVDTHETLFGNKGAGERPVGIHQLRRASDPAKTDMLLRFSLHRCRPAVRPPCSSLGWRTTSHGQTDPNLIGLWILSTASTDNYSLAALKAKSSTVWRWELQITQPQCMENFAGQSSVCDGFGKEY